VLETGAGWWGPIGEGTVTIRYPYKVNESTVVLRNWGRGICLPSPTAFRISGTEVIWHFTDLEPVEDDNICLTVLAPSIWEEITAAQRDVMAMPDSSEAHLRLARALAAVLEFEKGGGLSPVGNSVAFAELAEASFRRALELAPEDVEIYVDYLEFIRSMTSDGTLMPENLLRLLERALELAPDDHRLLQIQEWTVRRQSRFITPTPIPSIVPTPTPGLGPSPQRVNTPWPTAPRAHVGILTPTPRFTPATRPILTFSSPLATTFPLAAPTAASTLALASPLATATLPFTATSTPKPSDGAKSCFGAVAIGILPLSVLWANQTHRGRRE
jgi:hypothetical protein